MDAIPAEVMREEIRKLESERWIINKSAVSIDAGPTRIRQERSGSQESLVARARVIAMAPRGVRLARIFASLGFPDEDGTISITADQWTAISLTARQMIRCLEEGVCGE